LFRGATFDTYIHDTYRVISPGVIVFWLMIAMATLWFLIVTGHKISASRMRTK
jgi:hypothetical protein